MSVKQVAAARAGGQSRGAPPQQTDVAAELRRFLELGAAQLEAAVRESDTRVEQLACAISSVVTDARELAAEAQSLDAADPAKAQQARMRIRALTELLNNHGQTAVTTLQFYDKLVQRLTHVREGLAIPADTIAAAATAAADWGALRAQVRARYSTVEERVLFDFMMRGLNAEQMLNALTGMRAAAVPGEFEAF